MKFLPFVLLIMLNTVHADDCLLDEPQPECEGYCYTSVKPFLSYISTLHKRLEECETLNLPIVQDNLNRIKDQSAQQLKLTESWQKSFDDKLSKFLEDMGEQWK